MHIAKIKVLSIMGMDGTRIKGEESFHKVAIRYLSELVGKADVVVGDAVVHTSRHLKEDQRLDMVREVNVNEVKEALFAINSKKAKLPKGYNATFFKVNWDLVGSEIVEAIMSFFHSGKLLKAWNAMVLTLIPKVATPSTMADF